MVGSDDHEHDCADVESAASAVSAARSPPPPGATQLEDVTHSLGAALGLDPVPRSGSGVDDEANLDHMDSTFLDHFERDLGVLHVVDMTIHDGVRPHGGPVPEVGVPSASQEFVSVDAVVPVGVGYNARFEVLAEEDSDGEAMCEVRACRRRVAASPSFPPTEAGPVRPTEVARTQFPVRPPPCCREVP